jgi:hypothetical protein
MAEVVSLGQQGFAGGFRQGAGEAGKSLVLQLAIGLEDGIRVDGVAGS